MSVDRTVDSLIDDHPVQVFSKSYCPYCARVKKLFRELGVDAHITELDEVSDGDAIQNYLHQKTNQRTVPNVFINKKHIGGSDATFALHTQKKLVPLLQQAGLNVKQEL